MTHEQLKLQYEKEAEEAARKQYSMAPKMSTDHLSDMECVGFHNFKEGYMECRLRSSEELTKLQGERDKLIHENAELRDNKINPEFIIEFTMSYEAYRNSWSEPDESSRKTIKACLDKFRSFGQILKLPS